MIKIIVCDDDEFTLKLEIDLISKAIVRSGIESEICCMAQSVSEVTEYLKKHDDRNFLYFIDYDLGKKELNGIDAARLIKMDDPGCRAVFVTSHSDKGIEILKSGVQPFGFIEKHLNSDKMINEFAKYIRMADSEEKLTLPNTETKAAEKPNGSTDKISLPFGIDETINLNVDDISYVESLKSRAHTICYHTVSGSVCNVRDTIEHAAELLGDSFVRCHRSVLVNKNKVVSIDNSCIHLSTGEKVIYALNRKKKLMELCISNL